MKINFSNSNGVVFALVIFLLMGSFILSCNSTDGSDEKNPAPKAEAPKEEEWKAPDTASIPLDEHGFAIRYGRDLIANTSKYFGPKGSVAAITNGMNCQNCHVEAGSAPFGNSFGGVAAMYPLYRPRSGRIESIEFRVNDCLQRSMNGKAIDSLSKEMKAMVAYLQWIGKDVPKKTKPASAGTIELKILDRAADPSKGAAIFLAKCQVCHGANGQGQYNADSTAFVYPPLWGKHSFNTGSGMYRLSRFSGFVKYNMPFKTADPNMKLTDEEAWDVAAYVNSKPRPEKPFTQDWPKLYQKAFDHPYGPYLDTFPASQHKYGPFAPIKKAIAELPENKKAGK